MTNVAQIYVALLDEGVDLWCPVQAERLNGSTYRILSQPYDRSVESWQFEPGDVVLCEMVESSEGRILAATRKAGPEKGRVREKRGHH